MLLSQTTVQFLGDSFHLCHYSFLYLIGSTPSSTGLIFKTLTIAGSLVILSKRIPQTTATLGLEHFFNYIGCKLFSMFTGWARTGALASPSLIYCPGHHNMFHKLQVSELKLQALKYIRSSTILNMLENTIFSFVCDWQLKQ